MSKRLGFVQRRIRIDSHSTSILHLLLSFFLFFLSILALTHSHFFFSFSLLDLISLPSVLPFLVATEHGAVVAVTILVIVLVGVLRSVRVTEGELFGAVVRVVLDGCSSGLWCCNWLWLGVVVAKVDLVVIVVFI